MGLIRVHAAIGKQSEEMQPAATGARILHGREQNGVRKEFAILNHQLDAGTVHVHDASGTDVEMADFAVAHLSVGQADVVAAGLNQRVGIFAQQAVVVGLAGQGDGVGFGLGAVAPAVENDQHKRFGTLHETPGFVSGSTGQRNTEAQRNKGNWKKRNYRRVRQVFKSVAA